VIVSLAAVIRICVGTCFVVLYMLIPDSLYFSGRPISNRLACPVRLFTFRIDCLSLGVHVSVGIYHRFLRAAEMLWVGRLNDTNCVYVGIFVWA
jgi:hypothetical protein